MSLQTATLFDLDFFSPLPVVVEVSEAPLTTDAGLLPLREFDAKIGLTEGFAAALTDFRSPLMIEHSQVEMVRSRVFGIVAGYYDQNDHDSLRSDPVFKLIAGRSPDEPELASQPTLSRFENAIDIPSLKRLREVLVDQFIASFASPPITLTFDLDPVDDPCHGNQQLSLFHGFYEQNQYLPLIVSSAQTDQIVLMSLRHGTAGAALGAEDDLEFLVHRVRAVWPNTRIRVRGDGGLGVPKLMDLCERLDVIYTFGKGSNPVLKRESEALLTEAERLYEETGVPQRLFEGFWYRAESWERPRWAIVKAEANACGTNRRFILTNRPGAFIYTEATYDEYAMRGESENRNKEFKCGLGMDRLSDHRFLANFFRLYLHAAAMNLLARLRREVADPPAVSDLPVEVLRASEPPAEIQPVSDVPAEAPLATDLPAEVQPLSDVPAEALNAPARKAYANARRRRDPLGEGQPETWRMLVVKVAACVIVTCRRIVVRISGSWPYRDYLERLGQHIRRRPAVAHIWTG
jgi:hypothetical protein